jgi:hypothetical protein
MKNMLSVVAVILLAVATLGVIGLSGATAATAKAASEVTPPIKIDDFRDDDVFDASGRSHSYVRAALDDLLAGRSVKEPQTQPQGCGIDY